MLETARAAVLCIGICKGLLDSPVSRVRRKENKRSGWNLMGSPARREAVVHGGDMQDARLCDEGAYSPAVHTQIRPKLRSAEAGRRGRACRIPGARLGGISARDDYIRGRREPSGKEIFGKLGELLLRRTRMTGGRS
jgi:hypothetical protein